MEKEDKKYSILEEVSKSKGYDIALMTTFNFDIEFFERKIFNGLSASNVKKVSLFVDAKELNKAIKTVSSCYMGKKYMVTPVEMKGSFHPKLILLLGQKKAKLFVGSANITTSGYTNNNEIFNFVEYSEENPQYLNMINAAIDFFDRINANTEGLDSAIIEEAKSQIYYHKTESNGECFLIQNMDKSILEQALELIQEKITKICIAVPYYDKELAAYSTIKDRYRDADIILYIQDKKSTFPTDLNERKSIVNKIKAFSGFENGGKNSCDNFYHGKVFLFNGIKQDYILYGSANCTQSALIKSFAEDGNIECDFFDVGESGEFDYFFNSVKIVSGKKLESNLMKYETETDEKYFFRYGKLEDDIKLHIRFREKRNNIKIKFQGMELEYYYENNEIVATIPGIYVDTIPNVFNLEIEYDEKKEHLTCWYYNYLNIENYRSKQSDIFSLDSFDFTASGDKFAEDRINLLNAELASLPEFIEHRKNVALYNQVKQEQEEATEDNEDDFIVDVPIMDEYTTAYRQYKQVSKIIHHFVRQFMISDSSVFEMVIKSSHKAAADYEKSEHIQRRSRVATTEEKRFERFMKKKIKVMVTDEYVEVVEPEHYLGIIEVIFDIFKKYKKEEFVEDIFNTDYILDTRLTLFSKLIGKDLNVTETEGFEENIIAKAFSILIDNHVIAKSNLYEDEARKLEQANKNFLFQLEEKYKLRDCYQNYIKKSVELGESAVCTIGFESACSYIEELYDYKNLASLSEFIQKRYENAVIEHKGKNFYINVTTESMRKYYRPEPGVLREITKYGRNVSTVESVVITVTNMAPNYENKNIIARIIHRVSLQYHNWSATEIRVNGSKSNLKTQYIIMAQLSRQNF